MLRTLKQAWTSGDLKKRLLYTMMIIIVFRLGSAIPIPFLNIDMLRVMMTANSGGAALLKFFDTLSGGAFAQATMFALSVQPTINASIIMQLMGVAIPALEALQKEGEQGRKKINAITRVLTIVLGLSQSFMYYKLLASAGAIKYVSGFDGFFCALVVLSVFTAGTAIIMWLGERVNENGVGNGVSILLFAGIVSRMPAIIGKMIDLISQAIQNSELWINYVYVAISILIFLGMTWLIVFMNDAERRIPILYAKRVVGRRMFDGNASHLPLKIGLAGVMPIVFASSMLSLPQMLSFAIKKDGILKACLNAIQMDTWLYKVVFFSLIIMFAYFYVSISYDPLEISNNLRQSGATIPGFRPGKSTSDFLSKVLSKVTLMGALFLAFIAIFPMLLTSFKTLRELFIDGTSIIIMVGTALETVKLLQSQTMMRVYKGFLD